MDLTLSGLLRSNTCTLAPCCARYREARDPAGPAPTTAIEGLAVNCCIFGTQLNPTLQAISTFQASHTHYCPINTSGTVAQLCLRPELHASIYLFMVCLCQAAIVLAC